MSCVSSYQFVSRYNDVAIEKIRTKLRDMWNDGHDETSTELFPFNDPELNETGGKGCQFGDMYFCAFNYFDDTEFQMWLSNQNFEDIQVFFSGENDESMREIYPNTKQTRRES